MRNNSCQGKVEQVEASSIDILHAHGFETRKGTPGVGYVVETPRGVVDFDPGTGLWRPRGAKAPFRGVFALIAWATRAQEPRP